jgi:hypothetical protein
MRRLRKVSLHSGFVVVSLLLAFLALANSPFAAAQKLVIFRASDDVRYLDSGGFAGDARRTSTAKTPAKQNPESRPELFFPLTPGTWWLYRGTVQWTDSETNKPAFTQASIKMQVERVIQKPEFTIAVISGFPSDVGWSNGQVDPKPSLLIETRNHDVFLDELPPDFDYGKLEKDAASLDKFLSQENLLFRWPLKKGMKFGDPESVQRPDDRYCWVVATQRRKILKEIKGVPPKPLEVFLLQFVTAPEDTQMELSPGIGILSYQYHHHGTVADTSLSLVEFHPAQPPTTYSGAKP